MKYSYVIAISKAEQPLRRELLEAMREAGFTIACRTSSVSGETELPLHLLLNASKQTRTDLRILRLSKLSQVTGLRFIKVWRGMDSAVFRLLIELMRRLDLTFADYDPSKPSCKTQEAWIRRGLSSRHANALLREGIDDVGMVKLLSREDLTGIRLIGERGADMIEAACNVDTSTEEH